MDSKKINFILEKLEERRENRYKLLESDANTAGMIRGLGSAAVSTVGGGVAAYAAYRWATLGKEIQMLQLKLEKCRNAEEDEDTDDCIELEKKIADLERKLNRYKAMIGGGLTGLVAARALKSGINGYIQGKNNYIQNHPGNQ